MQLRSIVSGANIIKNGRITPKPFWNTIKIILEEKFSHSNLSLLDYAVVV